MNVPSRETLLDIEWLIHTHTAEGYEALLRVVRAGAEAYGGLVTAVAEAVLRLRWPSGDPRLLDAADIRHGLAHALATGSWSTDLDLVARLVARKHLGVGIHGDEVDAFHALADHVVDGIATCAAHAHHLDHGP